ncbi:MAG: SUMF1/EgtB/PvdO family nonheme iron enzyme [Polyangiaceae bacterium]|nr:SUMF1/EgtB/PvdO family nonheme iron enzyme [Polyangiaceae bacterium]
MRMLLALLLVACSASPAPGQSDPVASATAPPASSPSASEPPAPTTSAFASASAAPAGPSACPEGMLLVDGSYCPELEVKCLEQFYAESNHLWVCLKVQEPTQCLSPTEKEVPMRYCVDKYEFPNRVGERPMVMQNFYQAQVHCAKAGKRVCTEHEWTLACEGPSRKPFPYGYVRDPSKCNGDKPWDRPDKDKVLNRDAKELERLWHGKVSGSQPECVTEYGVHDMPGNADELAASVTTFQGNPKRNFDNVTTGGPWYYGVRNMCRPKIYTHDESFAYYYLSWRCCAEPDGKPTDPRTPKQIERGWTFEKVRHIAEHSWKLPLNPKWPGDPGYVSGGPK